MNTHAGGERSGKLGDELSHQAASVCQQFESTWRPDSVSAIESHVQAWQEPERSLLIRKLVHLDVRMRQQRGLACSPQTYSNVISSNDSWLLELFIDDLTRSLDTAEETKAAGTGSTGEASFAEADFSLRQFADYILLDELGRGGMGVVYRARQVSLNRLVALKMIAAGEFAGPDEIQRFRAEAEAAARLDHPGIVPVYEFGESAGRHFFSMALVEGNSLRNRVQQDGPLSANDAGRLVKHLSDAMAYAHAQGIIHRDLKPSNVLMADNDAPRISDFGLAKQLAAMSGSTHSGQILGSPSYMSPEQARGTADVDQHADIYGLGGVLYFVLTGRPPFQAASIAQTLRLVSEVDPVMPRSLNPAIPRDLETITIKCLQKEPSRRYDSAEELSVDLERFLNGQPIQARPVSRMERAVMWARRRPGVASLLAVLFIVLVGGTAISTYFAVERQMALNETQAEFERAEAALKDLRLSIDQYVDAISTEELLQEARFQPVIKRMLAHALAQYESYIERHAGAQDPETRSEIVQALMRVGKIHEMSSDVDQSLRAYEQALELQGELSQADPDNNDYQYLLSDLHLKIGALHRETGANAEAEASFLKSRGYLEVLVERAPQEGKYQRDLGLSHSAVGVLYLRTGKPQRALQEARKSLTIFEDLIEQQPDSADYRAKMATVIGDLSIAVLENGERDEALMLSARALQTREELAEQYPDVDDYRFELAISHSNYGNLISAKDTAAAREHYESALKLLTKLVDDNPTITPYRADLARMHNAIAVNHKNQGDNQQAVTNFEAALELQEQLAKEHPKVLRYLADLSGMNSNLGNIHKRLQQPAKALQAFESAKEITDELVELFPELTDLTINQAGILLNLGILHRTAFDDTQKALEALDQAVLILTDLRTRLPDRPIIPFLMRNVHLERAASHKQDENWSLAVDELATALSLDDGRDAANIHSNWTQTLAKAGDHITVAEEVGTIVSRAELDGAEPNLDLAFGAVRALAAAAAAAAEDTNLADADRQQQSDSLAARAMELLRTLSATGYLAEDDHRQELDESPDFDSLRERQDFAELLSAIDDGG